MYGRGGYYQRGRGRGGRGRGKGAASKKWVRPSQEDALNTNGGESASKTARVDSGEGAKSLSKVDTSAESSFLAKKSAPLLKGPSKRYPTAAKTASSRTWKRPRDDEEEELKSNESVASVSKQQNEKDSNVAVNNEQAVINDSTNATTKPSAKPSPKGDRGAPTDEATAPVAMKKRGRNKLILAKLEGESMVPVDSKRPAEKRRLQQQGEESSAARSTDSNEEATKILARRGKNKLVLQSGTSVANDAAKGKWSPTRNMGSVHASRGRGRGKQHHGAKRIKLNPTEEESAAIDGHDQAGSDVTEDGEDGSSKPAAAAPEKYTEFAYRQSAPLSQRGGRGRGRGRGARGRGASNMGLVRVEPNAATTRMCPIYLRGEVCTNPKCARRHDVPKEAAIPICSFFQRNGQCLKGDECQFRHIKVNPHATVCPSFSLLGFCENKDCIMKHVRPPRTNNQNK